MKKVADRLKDFAKGLCPVANPDEQIEVDLLREAAEEIERLREALTNLLPLMHPYGYGIPEREALRRAIKAARSALEAKP